MYMSPAQRLGHRPDLRGVGRVGDDQGALGVLDKVLVALLLLLLLLLLLTIQYIIIIIKAIVISIVIVVCC